MLPATARVPDRSSAVDGLLAAVLALALAAAAGGGLVAHARRVADRRVRATAPADVPFEFQTLTLQTAALASGRVLPIYGSSELFCCGSPFRPTQVFTGAASDFKTLALGKAGTADLVFLQTFAALGRALRGRKLVLSVSPSWFFRRAGVGPRPYAATFSTDVAYAFAFDGAVPRAVRATAARRMLAYPATLDDDPLLRLALADDAASGVAHAALAPLGGLARAVLAVRDAARTELVARKSRRAAAAPVASGGWAGLAATATRIAVAGDTTNPFGFADRAYREARRDKMVQDAVALYRDGADNRDGRTLPAPVAWLGHVAHSVEWRDFRATLRLLHALHARPLVWTMPLPGRYDDYTRRSPAARARFYDRWERTVRSAGVPWLDFRAHDEDPWFLTDPGSHFSARGWIFADRALDVFWHGGSTGDVTAAVADLDRAAPSPPVAVADRGGAR